MFCAQCFVNTLLLLMITYTVLNTLGSVVLFACFTLVQLCILGIYAGA